MREKVIFFVIMGLLFSTCKKKSIAEEGGIVLKYEIMLDDVVEIQCEAMARDMKNELKDRTGEIWVSFESKQPLFAYSTDRRPVDPRFTFHFSQESDMLLVDVGFRKHFKGGAEEVSRDSSNKSITFTLTDDYIKSGKAAASAQVKEIIGRRLDLLDINNVTISASGTDLVIELPAIEVDQLDRVKSIIGQGAKLEFMVVDDAGSKVFQEWTSKVVPDASIILQRETNVVGMGIDSYYLESVSTGAKTGKMKLIEYLKDKEIPPDHVIRLSQTAPDPTGGQSEKWRTWYLWKEAPLKGDYIADASVAIDSYSKKPYVSLQFDKTGADLFEKITGENVKKRLAIVLDDEVTSAPLIQEKIGGGRAQITLPGNKDLATITKEANDLTLALKSGALPVPIMQTSLQVIAKKK